MPGLLEMREGPPLEALLRRLVECPPDFLAEPAFGSGPGVRVPAVVSDVLTEVTGTGLSKETAVRFAGGDPRADRNRLRLVLVATWLLAAPELRPWAAPARNRVLAFLENDVTELASFAAVDVWLGDADRREELARRCLAALAARPAGETVSQAEDRLAALDSVGRQRVIAAAARAEQRTREVREAMARQAAYEASLKATRE